jgi:hypothetical protein
MEAPKNMSGLFRGFTRTIADPPPGLQLANVLLKRIAPLIVVSPPLAPQRDGWRVASRPGQHILDIRSLELGMAACIPELLGADYVDRDAELQRDRANDVGGGILRGGVSVGFHHLLDRHDGQHPLDLGWDGGSTFVRPLQPAIANPDRRAGQPMLNQPVEVVTSERGRIPPPARASLRTAAATLFPRQVMTRAA